MFDKISAPRILSRVTHSLHKTVMMRGSLPMRVLWPVDRRTLAQNGAGGIRIVIAILFMDRARMNDEGRAEGGRCFRQFARADHHALCGLPCAGLQGQNGNRAKFLGLKGR
jgi:hypothetical protein